MAFSWNKNANLLHSKTDWTVNPTATFSSTKHLSVLNGSNLHCDTSRVALGSVIESGGIFDLDDLQIFSQLLNDAQLKEKLLGKQILNV